MISNPSCRWVAFVTLGIALASVAACKRTEDAPQSCDIVLITLDTTRADHLGCYGYFRDTSPNIDAFGRECILFERCFAPMATTLPSHTSLLTGVYPLEHGTLANIRHDGRRFEPAPQLQSFAQVARAGGYQTAAFISAVPLKRDTGIDSGFDTFDQPDGAERRAAETNAAALRWLAGAKQAPIFLWVHYYDPHFPYAPPAPFHTRYQTDARLEEYLAARRFAAEGRFEGEPVRARESVDGYDSEIRYMDEHVGQLLSRLRARPSWARAVVIVVGDHGEGLCQHGEAGHGYIWDEQLRVPLLLRIPGQAARRINTPTSIVDILPTVLGAVGSLPRGGFLEQVSGRDVLKTSSAPEPVFSQSVVRQRSEHPRPAYSLTSAEWKYVYEEGGPEWLIQLSTDPFELQDVHAEHAETVADLQRQLLARLEAQKRKGAVVQAGRTGQSPPTDAKTLEQLRSLGYVDSPRPEQPTSAPSTAPAPAAP